MCEPRRFRSSAWCYLVEVLVAGFALLVVASGLGLWRVVARNQSAMRYLQEPALEDDERLGLSQLGPEKWAIVAPIRTLQLVVRGEIGALRFGSSSALDASIVVNAEISHWLAHQERPGTNGEDVMILDALSEQIRALWEQGQWGCSGSLSTTHLLDRLGALEHFLMNAASQVAAGRSPYR